LYDAEVFENIPASFDTGTDEDGGSGFMVGLMRLTELTIKIREQICYIIKKPKVLVVNLSRIATSTQSVRVLMRLGIYNRERPVLWLTYWEFGEVHLLVPHDRRE
jgi:hypothetical protein